MLEEMAAFFEARLDGYEEHMLEAIEGAADFYPFTAALLPEAPGAAVLDLGCGTGLELDWFFRRNPTARVTGIDLSQGMLDALKAKHGQRALTLVQGSYFDLPLGEELRRPGGNWSGDGLCPLSLLPLSAPCGLLVLPSSLG